MSVPRLVFLWCLLGVLVRGQGGPTAKIREIDIQRFPTISLTTQFTQTHSQYKSFLPSDVTMFEFGQPVPFTITCPPDPVAVVLVVDRSGSMGFKPNTYETDPDSVKWRSTRNALTTYVQRMHDSDQVALMTFSTTVQLIEQFTDNKDLLIESVNSIRIGGGTALWKAVYEAAMLLGTRPERRRVMIVLTDGADTMRDSVLTMSNAIWTAQRYGVQIFSVGLGDDVTRGALDSIATLTGGRFYFTADGSDLASIYEELSRVLVHTCHIEYQTPRPCRDGILHPLRVIYDNSYSQVADDSSFHAPLAPWTFSLSLPPHLRLHREERFRLPVTLDYALDTSAVNVDFHLDVSDAEIRLISVEDLIDPTHLSVSDFGDRIRISGSFLPGSTGSTTLCTLLCEVRPGTTSHVGAISWLAVAMGGTCPITPNRISGSDLLIEAPCDRIVRPRTRATILSIYPQPAREQVRVRWTTGSSTISTTATLDLRDAFGRILYSEMHTDQDITLDLTPYASGLYQIDLRTDVGTDHRTFIVTR